MKKHTSYIYDLSEDLRYSEPYIFTRFGKKGLRTTEEKVSDLVKVFNEFELLLNYVIVQYFRPTKNEKDFYKILLNGTVIGMGQKIKILANMDGFNKDKSLHKLGEILRIRNAVVHNNPFLYVNPGDHLKEDCFNEKIQMKIEVMNSSGQIKTKDFEEEYQRFNKLIEFVVPYIQNYNISAILNENLNK